MKLIVITTETFFEGEAEAINLLFENGLETLHLRKPAASSHETAMFIKQIRLDYHARIVLHDHYDLTKMFDLKGIHLNRRNQETYGWGSLESCYNRHCKGDDPKQSKLSISRSCHSFEEVQESRFFDYVFLSPVFDSISKVGYKQGFTIQQLLEARERKIIDERVIALGGITKENIPIARSYGFGGVAVLGALWGGFVGGNGARIANPRDRKLLSSVHSDLQTSVHSFVHSDLQTSVHSFVHSDLQSECLEYKDL